MHCTHGRRQWVFIWYARSSDDKLMLNQLQFHKELNDSLFIWCCVDVTLFVWNLPRFLPLVELTDSYLISFCYYCVGAPLLEVVATTALHIIIIHRRNINGMWKYTSIKQIFTLNYLPYIFLLFPYLFFFFRFQLAEWSTLSGTSSSRCRFCNKFKNTKNRLVFIVLWVVHAFIIIIADGWWKMILCDWFWY